MILHSFKAGLNIPQDTTLILSIKYTNEERNTFPGASYKRTGAPISPALPESCIVLRLGKTTTYYCNIIIIYLLDSLHILF